MLFISQINNLARKILFKDKFNKNTFFKNKSLKFVQKV
jgi:hypothetical protein